MQHRLHFLDVLEWLWLLNSYSDVVYPLGWGDKDTYRLAFTLAGREKEFQQVRHLSKQAVCCCSTGVWFRAAQQEDGPACVAPLTTTRYQWPSACRLYKATHEFVHCR